MKILNSSCGIHFLVIFTSIVTCQNGTNPSKDHPILPAAIEVIDNPQPTSIDDIITPSDKCKQIVGLFASAISNFTLCSVTNARPIHLCQWCISHYRAVVDTHKDFLHTVDDRGNPCQWYFTNLDRIEIVTDAYRYVDNLWTKGKCEYCFQKSDNSSDPPKETEDVVNFDYEYEMTKSCFDKFISSNQTKDACNNCSQKYEQLNNFYIDIGVRYGENVCLDIVDTMNTTREIWSDTFKCVPDRKSELPLHIAMGLVMAVPVLFYFLAFILSTTTEASVLQQRRLAEIFSVTSADGPGPSQPLQNPPQANSPGLSKRKKSPTQNTTEEHLSKLDPGNLTGSINS